MLDFYLELNTLAKVLEKPNVNLMAFPFLYKVWTRSFPEFLFSFNFKSNVDSRVYLVNYNTLEKG
jgi:hypothetical protein